MSKRYPGGLITKTPVTPTTSSAPGVWTLEQALQYIKAGTWPATVLDPFFPYVTMLLHGDGTNGAQNNTFLDSSTNNFTITRNGNTTQGSFSPYGANWSNYFDGSGDYLTTANSNVNNFGSSDWTMEFWINSTQTTRTDPLGWNYAYTSAGWAGLILNLSASGQMSWYEGTSQRINATSTGWNNGAWNHIAISRSGNSVRMFLNGTQQGSTYTTSLSYGANSTGFIVGINNDGTGPLNGYISNLRIVKGTAVYTSAFTPPTTPLTAIANTSLLTCQSNRFIDNSTNAFAITRNGDVSVQRFSPFSPSAAYSTSVIGGSGYFDGSGDNLSIANTANLQFGTSDYTIEGFVYPTANDNSDKAVISKDASGQRSWFLGLRSSYGLAFWIGASNQTGTNAIALNAWTHFAVVRSGTSGAFFINGTRVATFTDANNYTQTAPVEIGGNNPVYNNPFTGFITDARLVKGTAVYSPSSTTITIPTAPLTAVSNTQLLCNMTNGGIFDNAMMNNLETVGNAQISTSVVKFGTGSMAFDGSGDWLTAPNSKGLYIGSGNFTIEGWLYLNALGSTKGIVSQFNSNGTGPGWTLYTKTTNVLEFYAGSGTVTVTGTTAISATTWTHFAVVRNGSTITIYINGTAGGTATNSSFSDDTAALVYIGGRADSAALSFNGYIDDLRITKGYARYTANFTPPTAAFPNQ